jgi:hypothetical protein
MSGRGDTEEVEAGGCVCMKKDDRWRQEKNIRRENS